MVGRAIKLGWKRKRNEERGSRGAPSYIQLCVLIRFLLFLHGKKHHLILLLLALSTLISHRHMGLTHKHYVLFCFFPPFFLKQLRVCIRNLLSFSSSLNFLFFLSWQYISNTPLPLKNNLSFSFLLLLLDRRHFKRHWIIVIVFLISVQRAGCCVSSFFGGGNNIRKNTFFHPHHFWYI